ncbi:MAG: acetyl-CoA carboxylase biotin carboxylase subunit [bacterium]|nr:acetyl-CoA carboxylase biotin carboxylase subunit [bacterium]
MFKKILIANRGEIAIRVMRACRELGIQTVAVYSAADKSAQHRFYADESVFIGEAPSTSSYLVKEKIIQAALDTGAEAIHPGYGFLSEKSDFARAVTDAGLVFIGPTAESIEAMGSKTSARKLMKAAGVPVAPGLEEPVSDFQQALQIARDIGFPVLIKAAHGGGGKGMRKVFHEGELETSLAAAMRESLAAFHSNEVYIEKFIHNPHHIEVQVLADRYGNTIHLGERECSVQRRHQKLIEESPSPFLRDDVRKKICEAAVIAAKSANYINAGTVEFLVDENQNFYFLEMNTRLQVEHPVTEWVTGIDIVHQQIKIAAGEPLQIKQQDVQPRGWAIECRICAEDPMNNFLPSSGIIHSLHTPAGPGIRDDRGFEKNDEISIYYDSLLAKLITYGENRETAINRMLRALNEYKIVGVSTTIPFFISALTNSEFLSGNYNTGFIEKHFSHDNLSNARKTELEKVLIATVIFNQIQKNHSTHRIQDSINTDNRKPNSSWKLYGRMEGLRRN